MYTVPQEYHRREQTFLKHRVLEEYLAVWSHKLGSIPGRHLWYVDVFAGPWESKGTDRADTSVAIGLKALRAAATTWEKAGRRIQLHAVFVEKNPKAFAELRAFTAEAGGNVDVQCFPGAFADHVEAIDRRIGNDAAFIFVDPTGWDGASLRDIARLAARGYRDVLINVMYDHINRFKDDEREFLRHQMREFFGLGDDDMPRGLDEEALMRLYRQRLRERSGVPYVADLAVPMPTRERTKFRLVVAGHHPAVLKLFREVEARVIGKEAAAVRTEARERESEEKSLQLSLFAARPPDQDPSYAAQNSEGAALARETLTRMLFERRLAAWQDLWPDLLCELHLPLTELNAVVLKMEAAGVLRVHGRGPRQRTLKDEHRLEWTGNQGG